MHMVKRSHAYILQTTFFQFVRPPKETVSSRSFLMFLLAVRRNVSGVGSMETPRNAEPNERIPNMTVARAFL